MVNNSNEFAVVPPPATATSATYFRANANETPIAAFRRRPSSLLQCMDRDGNIDAYRYIEYSRKRRIDFLNRANFICKMKCSLQKQQRSWSLPGVTVPTVSAINTAMNDVLSSSGKTTLNTPANDAAFRKTMKNLSRCNGSLSLGAVTTTTTTTAAETTRVMPRSSSLPLPPIPSFVNNEMQLQQRVVATDSAAAQQQPPRRQLRREEFEAAEALLFSMGRVAAPRLSGVSSSPSLQNMVTDKRNDASSLKDGKDGDDNNNNGSHKNDTPIRNGESRKRETLLVTTPMCTKMPKKRKIDAGGVALSSDKIEAKVKSVEENAPEIGGSEEAEIESIGHKRISSSID